MYWLVLVFSGVLEAVWATALGRSAGLTRLVPTVVFAVGLVASMAGLAQAMRGLPVGTAYAVWVGIGAALTAGYAMWSGRNRHRSSGCSSSWASWAASSDSSSPTSAQRLVAARTAASSASRSCSVVRARPAGRSERDLGGVDRPPVVDQHRSAPRARSSSTRSSTGRRRAAPSAASASSEATVSRASCLLVPTTPLGPRLIQPATYSPGDGCPSRSTRPVLVRHGARPLVDRQAGQRRAEVAHRADDEVGRQHVQLAGAHRPALAVDRGALHLHAGDPVLAEQPHGPGEEAQAQPGTARLGHVVGPAAQHGEIAGDVAVGRRRSSAARVELEVGCVDQHRRAVQLAELAQFLGGERACAGPAPAQHGDLLDRRRGEDVQHVLGHVGRLELGRRPGEHPGDVQRDVADADDHDRPDAGQGRLHPGPVGVGVPGVPGDQLGGGQAAGQVLAVDPQVAVEGGAVGVDDGVDVPAQFLAA